MGFNENLKSLRNEAGLTQEALAQAISVSRTLITKYENGTVLPTDFNLSRLASYFAVSVETLNGKKSGQKKPIPSYIMLLILALYNVYVWLPIFSTWRYVYPPPPGELAPEYVRLHYSIMQAASETAIPFGIVTIATTITNFAITLLLLKKPKVNYYKGWNRINKVVFAVNIFLIVAATLITMISITRNLY